MNRCRAPWLPGCKTVLPPPFCGAGEIGADRVDAGKLQPENLKTPAVTGGYLLKRDRLDPGDNGLFAGGESVAFVDPHEAELKLPARAAQYNYIQSYMNGFGTALNRSDFTNRISGYRSFIDTASWVDHHLLNVLALNVDALRLSAYFYKPRNGKLTFGPLWDIDRTLGSTDGRDADPRVWRSTVGDLGTDFFGFSTQAWWGRLFQDPDFFQDWIDRYETLRRTHFSTTNLWRLQDTLASQVKNAQPWERQKWGVTPRDGSYAGEVAFSKRWLSNRVEFMDAQLVRMPRFNTEQRQVTNGFLVELTLPVNTVGRSNYTIYYTLDGTDPRLPGGGLSPSAQIYAVPLTIKANTRVFARSRNPNPVQLSGAVTRR